ncbi:MAG: hypothetical protein IPP72_21955 [Chitinophagaceae bacterium]|nr:hypothetical protein [Chitinophagaceae bacterium]
MQENEFEKKLQQKMEVLQLQPADEVWQKIQIVVAKSKERKRRFAFFFLLCLLLTGGLLLTDTSSLFNHKTAVSLKEQPGAARVEQVLGTHTKPTEQLQPEPNNQLSAQEKIITDNTTAETAVKQNNLVNKNTVSPVGTVKLKAKGRVGSNVTMAAPDEENTAAADIVEVKKQGAIISADPVIELKNEQDNGIPEKQATVLVTAPGKNEVTAPVIAAAIAPGEKECIEINNKKVAVDKNPMKTINKKNWGLALVFSAGGSATGNGYANKSLAADNYGNAGNIPGSNPGSSGNISLPSSTRTGIAFSAGVKLFRNVSARSKITAGLQYQLITTFINTGERIYASSAQTRDVLFSQGSIKSYNNRYHLISLPVGFSTRIFNLGKNEVTLDAGVVISRMFNSNALNFNTVAGMYYSDRSVFNKTIVGLSAAALINLNPTGKTPFCIGPEFYYSATPLASSGMYATSHYRFFGIRLQKNLTK